MTDLKPLSIYSDKPASVRLKTLLTLRWVAIFGQISTIAVVAGVLNFNLPILALLPLLFASLALNVYLHWRLRESRISEGEFVFYLLFDTAQLTAMLFLTGGLQNPFSAMLLVYVTVAASILSKRGVIAVCSATFLCLTFLAFIHHPLPWRGEGLLLERLYSCGVWTALMIASAFVAIYVRSLVQEARQMAVALSATEDALSRERRLSAMGSLAAATAHQLGTPLNTITLIAHDLCDELPFNHKLRADAETLLAQSKHCSVVLSNLGKEAKSMASGQSIIRLPLSAAINLAAEDSHAVHKGIAIRIKHAFDVQAADPVVLLRPEFLHAMGNFLSNAAEYAESEILIEWDVDGDDLRLSVTDDGEGFDPALLSQLGEPYIVRLGKHPGMGLGIFIAKTLIEKLGGDVRFSNAVNGGACVSVRLPSRAICAPDLSSFSEYRKAA